MKLKPLAFSALPGSGVPQRYRKFTLEAWDGKFPRWLGTWRGDPWCVYVFGLVGCGKTHLLTAYYIHYAERCIPTVPVRWLDTAGWLDAMRQEFDDRSTTEWDNAVRARLLMMDDLGSERLTDWAKERISLLLRERHSHERATLITSNFGLERVANDLDPRLASRLSEGIVWEMPGEDHRKVQENA